MSNARPGGANVPPFDAVADVRKFAIFRDDFIGNLGGTLDDTNAGISELGWKVTDVAGAGDSDLDIITTAATILDHPGVVSLNTGPTTPAANDEAGLTLPGAVVLPDSSTDGLVYAAAVVRFPSVTSIEFNFGLFDLSLGAQRDTDSICIELDASAAAYFVGAATAGSSAVGTDVSGVQTTVAIDTWYTLEVAADQSSAYFWVNGELLGEIVGTQTALPLYPGFKVTTETTAEKSVLIDAFGLRVPTARKGYTGVG